MAALSLCASSAQAFTVFACEPEWAALTRVLLPQAQVYSATHAQQDPHHIEARPALIAQLRRADLVVCTGAGLEEGWLPTLQQRAGNPKARDVFWAVNHVDLIDAQPHALATPWAGDVHAAGNPHVHADPYRLLAIAQALAARLQKEQPAQAPAIAQRLDAFAQHWQARIGAWEHKAAPLRGQTIVIQHSSLAYLWQWLGLQPLADLEPRPGMAPTPGHLQRLLDTLRGQPVRALVLASYQDSRSARWLAAHLPQAVPVLVLPATVTQPNAPDALTQWMDQLIDAMTQAMAP